MSILDDFLPFRDRFGMNQLSSVDGVGQTTQNGALFTMEYLVCLIGSAQIPEAQKEINRLWTVFESLEVKPGQSVRSPGSDEFNSMDNEVAMLLFSLVFGARIYANRHRDAGRKTFAKRIDTAQDPDRNTKFYPLAKWLSILTFAGFSPRNYWNANEPEAFCFMGWHGRSPGFMGWIDIAATGDSTMFRKFALWVGQMLALFSKKGDADPWKLGYLIWYHLKYRGWIWKVSYKIWTWKLTKMYGADGMKAVYAMYYPKGHPIAQYSVPYIP